jgi:hypothetical protein
MCVDDGFALPRVLYKALSEIGMCLLLLKTIEKPVSLLLLWSVAL